MIQRQGVEVSKSTRNYLIIIGLVSEDGSMNGDDLRDYARKLIRARKRHVALRRGDFSRIYLSKENGWVVKQLSNKYRNPDHAPDTLHARMALAQFEQNPELTAFWEPETLDGQDGVRYYRRINVEASCLGCHDLRGMYAVFIPAVQDALQSAVSN